MLLRKFSELACDEMAEMRWQETQPAEVDNIDVGALTEADLKGDLLATSDDPFLSLLMPARLVAGERDVF